MLSSIPKMSRFAYHTGVGFQKGGMILEYLRCMKTCKNGWEPSGTPAFVCRSPQAGQRGGWCSEARLVQALRGAMHDGTNQTGCIIGIEYSMWIIAI